MWEKQFVLPSTSGNEDEANQFMLLTGFRFAPSGKEIMSLCLRKEKKESLLFAIPVTVVGLWWLSRNRIMPIKMKGLIFAVLGFALAYLFRNDSGEGPFMRPVGFIVGIVGVYFYFEGLKNEIVSSICSKKSESEQDGT